MHLVGLPPNLAAIMLVKITPADPAWQYLRVRLNQNIAPITHNHVYSLGVLELRV